MPRTGRRTFKSVTGCIYLGLELVLNDLPSTDPKLVISGENGASNGNTLDQLARPPASTVN